MTVPSATSSIVYTADGTTAVFPYTWEIAQSADLIVYTVAVGATVAVKKALTTDYTVSGIGIATGGNVTLVAGNPAVGARVFIASDPAQIQATLLEQGIAFNPADVMAALDLLTRQVQATRRIANGALQLPTAESLDGYTSGFPLAAARANKVVGFDGAGNAAALSGVFTGVAIETTIQVVDTIAALKTLAAPAVAVSYFVRGYGAAGDGGGGFFRWNAADASADNAGTIIQPNSLPGTGRWNRVGAYAYVLDVTTFGAKGDNATDDYAAIQACLNLLSAAGGGIAIAKPGTTYKCATAPTVPAGVVFDLCRATLHLTLSGNLVGVQMRADSEIRNGTITVNGTNLSGTDGKWHCPVVVGDTLSNTGYADVRIRSLTINGDRANGNGVLICGASNNVIVENLTFPSSANMGRCVLVHWAGDGATPPALTTHPYNVLIRNIQAGAMTNASSDQGIVSLSGCYNVYVEGVECDQAKVAVIYTTCGDYGAEYAAAAVKPLVNHGVRVRGAIGKLCNKYGIWADSWEDNFGGAPIVSMPVVFEDCHFVGDNTAGATAGIRALKQKDATFRNCEATKFVNGALIDDSCERVRVDGGRFCANLQHGVSVNHANLPIDCAVIGVESYGNGTDAATNYAGVFIGGSTRAMVERCILGDKTTEATQLYGVRVDDGSGAVGASVIDCYVRNTKAAGTAYSLGSGSSYGVVLAFHGNQCASGITNYRGGVDPITVDRIPSPTSGVARQIMSGSAAPTTGTWVIGDTVYKEQPTSGGFIGWVCTTGGTPGTWKTFGVIS